MTARGIRYLAGCILAAIFFAGRAAAQNAFEISSPAFASGQPLPARCARAHENVSPELRITGVPAQVRSLALVVDDPDAPAGLWTHWLIWNLPIDTASIPEGGVPAGAVQGKNSDGEDKYDGPSPPSGTHRYFFHLYALDGPLDVPAGASREALLAALHGHVVAKTEVMGTYAAGR